MRTPLCLLFVLACATLCFPDDSRVTGHEVIALDGQWIDFEHATVLSTPEAGGLAADVQFLRKNEDTLVLRPHPGVRIEPVSQVAIETEEAPAPTAAQDCVVPSTGSRQELLCFVLSTRRGLCVRARAMLANQSGVPQLVGLTFEVQHDGSRKFPRPVAELSTQYRDGGIDVTWAQDARARHVVRWRADGSALSEVTVEQNEARITPVQGGACYQIEVCGLSEDGAGVPSCTSVLAADAGVRRGRIEAPNTRHHGYSVSFRKGCLDDVDPDWVPFFWGMRVPPGGGILKLGEGQEAFDEARALPMRGYLPVFDRFDEGDVLAIRLADGRYVKVLIRPETGDVREKAVFDYVFLERGGNVEPAGPTGLVGRVEGGHVVLSWEACAAAATYEVKECDGATERVISSVRETTFVVAESRSNRWYEFVVEAKDRHGAGMGACRAKVSTFLPWWTLGKVDLGWSEQNGFDFARGTDCHESGDFWITSSAGGMSSLRLASRTGICNRGLPDLEGKREREVLEELDKLEWSDEIETDDRESSSERFAVKTSEGTYAIVRIGAEAKHGRGRTFEYIHLTPPRDLEEMARVLREEGLNPDEATHAQVQGLIARLDSEDFEEREGAQAALVALPRSAVIVIAETVAKGEISVEVRERLRSAAAQVYRGR